MFHYREEEHALLASNFVKIGNVFKREREKNKESYFSWGQVRKTFHGENQMSCQKFQRKK